VNQRLTRVTRTTGDKQTFAWDVADNRTVSVRAGVDAAPVVGSGVESHSIGYRADDAISSIDDGIEASLAAAPDSN